MCVPPERPSVAAEALSCTAGSWHDCLSPPCRSSSPAAVAAWGEAWRHDWRGGLRAGTLQEDDKSEELKGAASVALGGLTTGALPHYLPPLLQAAAQQAHHPKALSLPSPPLCTPPSIDRRPRHCRSRAHCSLPSPPRRVTDTPWVCPGSFRDSRAVGFLFILTNKSQFY